MLQQRSREVLAKQQRQRAFLDLPAAWLSL